MTLLFPTVNCSIASCQEPNTNSTPSTTNLGWRHSLLITLFLKHTEHMHDTQPPPTHPQKKRAKNQVPTLRVYSIFTATSRPTRRRRRNSFASPAHGSAGRSRVPGRGARRLRGEEGRAGEDVCVPVVRCWAARNNMVCADGSARDINAGIVKGVHGDGARWRLRGMRAGAEVFGGGGCSVEVWSAG